ncbi:Intracellular serine protease [Metarhizium anisopliae]
MSQSSSDKIKMEKHERGRTHDKSKKASSTKVAKGKKPGNTQRPQHTANEHDNQKEETLSEILSDALQKFPDTCTEACNPVKCERMSCKQRLHDFEVLFKTKLKDMTQRAQEKQDNTLHLLVKDKGWKSEHTTPPKRLFDWMLQQREHDVLLQQRDPRGFTPVHNALYDHVHDFIDVLLKADRLSTISILRQDFAGSNCIHLATQHASPHLSTMIHKCKGDNEIFMDGDKTEKGTPLHIAVQDVFIPVVDEVEEDDSDPEDQGLEDDDQDGLLDCHDNADHDSHHLDEDVDEFALDSDYESSSLSEYETDLELEEVKYRFENKEEREKRLVKILDDLDKEENTRPRPPPRTHDANPDNPQRMGAEDAVDDLAKENNSPSIPKVVMSQGLIDLPPDHSVRLLVEAYPKALIAKNSCKRTPYQEREHVLLSDDVVKRLVQQYAHKKGPRGDTMEIREARAKRTIIVQDPVARYIMSYCIRESKSRELTMQQLYKPGQERHIEFDLEGFPSPSVTHNYFDNLGKHLQFESILRYVALPVLSVEPPPSRNPRIKQVSPTETQYELHRNGRSDLVTVFDWLWSKGVREIVKIRVVDGDLPHADASIVEALYGFNVKMWDWKRVDLCSDVIYESSPVIKEVSVYSSGNNAVLIGWASEDGLGNREKFPCGLEDDKRWQSNNRLCQKKITEHGLKGRDGHGGKEIEFKIIIDNDQGRSTTENIEPAPAWIKSTRQFATLLMNASREQGKDKQVAPVKIAIIDDGIDATLHDLQSKIAGGATFCPYPHSSELVNSYFVPRGKHGTLMAQLICDLCPGTELYIARLEELPLLSGSGRRVTARSAAKAVEWAVNCGVDIISMSWTIQTAAHDSEDMSSLESALNNAKAAKIHMFCSASDQGANTKEEYFPGDWKQCIRIGGATFTGEKLTWVDDKVDFWFPGRNVPFLSRDGKSVVYDSGSSIATAAASGLAGLLIYSARLIYSGTNEARNYPFHTQTAMAAAFRIMAKGMDGKFPRTDEVLNKLFKNKIQQATQKPPKSLDMETLEWSDSSKKALTDLLLHIQVGSPIEEVVLW